MIQTEIIDKMLSIVGVGLNSLESDKNKTAASIAGLPPCFEYSEVGGQFFAKPNLKAVAEYLKHLREVWVV